MRTWYTKELETRDELAPWLNILEDGGYTIFSVCMLQSMPGPVTIVYYKDIEDS